MAQDQQSEADMVCRMETFAKSFSVKIIGYSLIEQLQPENGVVVGTFNLGGHTWSIKFSPYGRDSESGRSFNHMLKVGDTQMREIKNKVTSWDSKEGADVVFRVGEETFSLHRTVLATHSPVFKAELFGPTMLESTKTECLKINDIKPEVFKLMLNFMYTDVLPLKAEISFEMAQHLLVAADRYGLEMLKLFCLEKLIGSLDVHNITAILDFSDKHNLDLLKEICLDFIAISVTTLQDVMATDGFKPLMEKSPSILHKLLEKAGCQSYVLSFLGIEKLEVLDQFITSQQIYMSSHHPLKN